MKKILLVVSGIFLSVFTANAGINGVAELQKKKEAMVGKHIISKGFYVNLGLAFPTSSFTSDSYSDGSGLTAYDHSAISLGIQPNIEIGNQWYFWKNDKFGVGIRVSWLQFGFSSSSYSNYYASYYVVSNTTNIDLRLLKVAPQFTYAITKAMALDFSFEFAPVAMFGIATSGTSYASGGILFAPGVKFRYNIFAAGADFGFGTLRTVYGNFGSFFDGSGVAGKSSIFAPRIYIGLKL